MSLSLVSPRQREAVLPVSAHDEFSPLTEVVVGSAVGARLPDPRRDISAWLNLYPDLRPGELDSVHAGAMPRRVAEESEEDLAELAEVLTGLGVQVHRPAPVDHGAGFGTPHWRVDGGFYSYCPRDLALITGSAILECPSPMRARYHELEGLRPLFQQRLLAGSVWLSAPKPLLRDELYGRDVLGRPVLGEAEPVLEAANVLRCGRDLLVQVSTSGNELGRVWLETSLHALGDYRVHPVRGLYPYTHLDSTLALLRPGLVLANPERVAPDTLPAPLRGWDVVWCPPMRAQSGGPGVALSSPWIGMNLLMVRPDLAVVDAAQPELIALLERQGIEVVAHRLRHARALGGGLHCVTLDLRRSGELTDYTEPSSGRKLFMSTPQPGSARPETTSEGTDTGLARRFQVLAADSAPRRALQARSRVQHAVRHTLHEAGFLEVDTPLLQRARPAPGRSFRTETHCLDPHTYLRSSPLHLRGLLTTGQQQVFEIGRSFRDEPVDATHSPEYSLIELYQAGANDQAMRTLAQTLICAAATAVHGTTTLSLQEGRQVDLAGPWPVIEVYQALTERLGFTVTPDTPAGVLAGGAWEHDVRCRDGADADELVLTLYDALVEPATSGPAVYTGFPAGPSPLAEQRPGQPGIAQKWDLVIVGAEIATGYTETAHPADLRRRLQPDGDRILPAEAATLDDDWLSVFDTGLPSPSGGLCIGLERLLLLLLPEARRIDDVIPFPLGTA